MNTFQHFQDVLEQEGRAILAAKSRLEKGQVDKLIELYHHLKASAGDLAVCGVGKSGQIGQKMVSTFNSIGLKSFFLHPIEALHGDLGRMGRGDVVALISKSGATEEIVKLIPHLPIPKERIMGLVGRADSPIAKACHLVFDCSVEKEACLNNQAPTTSSTVTLAIGDAMAVAWESFTELSREDFALNHPAGPLGKSMRLKVAHLMLSRDECAVLTPTHTLGDAIIEMTTYPTGLCAVVEKDVLEGILVEGDIRRALVKKRGLSTPLKDLATPRPVTIGPDELASKALSLMEMGDRPLNILPVVRDRHFLGALRLHDLLKEGLSPETSKTSKTSS
ncbi:MAG: KpsF/GutQ family sugar-phosphate isomerase [Bacteriovoracales bacterium]|nr:KpsF/GutQ family sugar-phosphate isomerase [Bacteriovoracales bacterium]